jgi:diguanylate cyclase (GGDEF)-like protein
MRVGARNDLFLLFGLAIALFAIVSQPLGDILDYARAIDEDWDLELVPGLVILAVVFMVHQIRKRHESRALALTSAAEARQATARAAEMERLLNFGRALGESLDHDAIGAVAAEHLPTLAEGRGAWAVALSGTRWRPLAVVADRSVTECEIAARQALGDMITVATVPNDVCFPMIVGGQPIGVIGIASEPRVTEHERIVLAAAAALLGAALKNAELFEVVHDNSVRDALTGCFNRQHALEVIDSELRRARRSKLPLALIIFDLDHFKDVNDRYGHLCGDAVLAAVGHRMKTVLRGSDVKCRWGGEEFLVLLPDTDAPGAERVAEILRHDLEEHPVKWHVADIHVADVSVTASLGVTFIVPGEMDVTAIITRADAALYRAKEAGRNRVCLADPRQAIA